MNKKDIKNFTLKELEGALTLLDVERYRAKQLFKWLYQAGVQNFAEMNNISQTLKAKLEESYYVGKIVVQDRLKSTDRTEKILFKLQDGCFIEAVLIKARHRNTLCLSTQAGCKFACVFCASGRNGFKRNLIPPEIINQIIYVQKELKCKITNYVFMGMGEPLDNFENVQKAIAIMNDPNAFGIGARRITISTCGIIPGIEKLGSMKEQINLSISLHAADSRKRDMLMPVNKLYPLKKLIDACRDLREKKGRMITIEYVLIKGVNDSSLDARGLAEIAKKIRAKINLIPYSMIPGFRFKAPETERVELFMKQLVEKSVNVTLRASKGKDVQAACGQLAGTKK